MSHVTPYSPLHPPRKHVSQEEMWEKLAKHAKPQVQIKVPEVGESPKEKLRLQWGSPVRTGRLSGYVLTLCGGYSISKDISGDDSVSYTAWKLLPDLPGKDRPYKQIPVHLGCVLSRAEAEVLAQADADAKAGA